MIDGTWDPRRSRAVLVGTATYTNLPSVPAARNSLTRMERLLTGELCGWPQDRVSVFSDQHSRRNLPDRLVELFHADDVRDVALFYFVGHGQPDATNTLCLGLVDSLAEAARRKTTSLPFDAVRDAFWHCRAKAKVVILDCCYAGLATSATLAADDVLDLTRGTGAYTLAATGEFGRAWFEPGDPATSQTYFTKYLADVVERGVSGEGEYLRLQDIFHTAAEQLAHDGKPVPTSRATDFAPRLTFAHNAAWVADPAPAAEAAVRTERTSAVEPPNQELPNAFSADVPPSEDSGNNAVTRPGPSARIDPSVPGRRAGSLARPESPPVTHAKAPSSTGQPAPKTVPPGAPSEKSPRPATAKSDSSPRPAGLRITGPADSALPARADSRPYGGGKPPETTSRAGEQPTAHRGEKRPPANQSEPVVAESTDDIPLAAVGQEQVHDQPKAELRLVFKPRSTYDGHEVIGQGDGAVLVDPVIARDLRSAAESATQEGRLGGGLLYGRGWTDDDGSYLVIDGFREADSVEPAQTSHDGRPSFTLSTTDLRLLRQESARMPTLSIEMGWWRTLPAPGAFEAGDFLTQRELVQPGGIGLLVFGSGADWGIVYHGPAGQLADRATPFVLKPPPAPPRAQIPGLDYPPAAALDTVLTTRRQPVLTPAPRPTQHREMSPVRKPEREWAVMDANPSYIGPETPTDVKIVVGLICLVIVGGAIMIGTLLSETLAAVIVGVVGLLVIAAFLWFSRLLTAGSRGSMSAPRGTSCGGCPVRGGPGCRGGWRTRTRCARCRAPAGSGRRPRGSGATGWGGRRRR